MKIFVLLYGEVGQQTLYINTFFSYKGAMKALKEIDAGFSCIDLVNAPFLSKNKWAKIVETTVEGENEQVAM